MTFLMLLSLNPLWNIGLFNLAGKTDSRSTVEVTLQVIEPIIWNKQGAGKLVVGLNLENTSQINHSGELRLVVAAINGRINFDAVRIDILQKPDKIRLDIKPPGKNFYTGFFRESNITLTKAPQHWQFRISLPPGSRQPQMALQLFAIYMGTTAKKSWKSTDTLLLSNTP